MNSLQDRSPDSDALRRNEIERIVQSRTAELHERVTALEAARAAIESSEAQYRHVVQNVRESIAVFQDERIVFGNLRLGDLLGYPLDAIIGHPFADYVYPDDLPEVAERHRRRVRGEPVPSQYAVRLVHRSGRVVWAELSVTRIQWGERPAVLGFITDISERRALEESLRRSLEEREVILENSIVGIVFLNSAGRMQWANRAAVEMFGMDRERAIGQSTEPYYLSRAHYEEIGREALAAVREGRSYQCETRMRRVGGAPFWVFLTGKAVNPSDESEGTVWAFQDIDERKRLEHDLRRTSFEREAILQSTLVGITFSIDRVHQWVNRTFAEMLGREPGELIGACSRIHFPSDESWQALGAAAYPVLERGEPFEAEWQMQRKDGSLFWTDLYGRALEPGNPSRGTIWTFVDITERRRAQEDMAVALAKQRELNELKSRFVSMTSHEFRTPLAAILSSAELLRDFGDRLPAAERAELIGIVESSVRRMGRMLDSVLTIGKAEAGQLDFAPAPLDLRRVCEDIADEVRRALADRVPGDPARLVLRFTTEPGTRRLDERLLRQILGNLLSNGLKYSPAGGEVRCEISADGRDVEIVVADRGIGIPEDDLPHLFETFHRGRNAGNIPGTGLGMAIVGRAVERHGGAVTVESRVGEGTRFVVRLPEG